MTPSRRVAAASVLLSALAAAGCASGPTHRYFQPSTAQIGPYPNSYGEAVIPRGGLVVVQGDDLAYGLSQHGGRREINDAAEPQGPVTISETLRRVVKGVRVENRGYPGDTVVQSAVRWADAPAPDLAILAYGYGDAQAHTTQKDFSTALGGLIGDLQAHGATVFVVIPPPISKGLPDLAVKPYRDAARLVARGLGAEVFEGADAVTRLKVRQSKTSAQRPAVYQAIGADIVPYVRVVTPSPQTGQAGSADSRTVRDSPANPS